MKKEKKGKTKIEKNKKRKVKKSFIISFIILIILIILCIIGKMLYTQNTIKSNFSHFVITTTDKNIYKKENKKYKKIGTLYKNNIISLEKIEGKYYKLKKENYYITYKKVKKTKEKAEDKINNIVFNENVITKKNIVVLKNNKKYFKINEELELPILEYGDDFYTCLYNNKVLQIKKSDVKEVKKVENTKEEIASSMPVIYFDKEIDLENYVKVFNESKIKSITKEEYIKWLNGKIVFPTKTAFIVLQEENENNKKIMNKYKIQYAKEKDLDLKFVENDVFSKKENLYWYKINNFTTISRFQDILNGVKLNEEEYATRIAVLNYHFFSKEGAACNEVICLDDTKFEEQLKYLKENNYKSLTMEEYNKWLKGEIELPKKSVLLTVDDGALGTDTVLPDMLDKYNQKATLFLITSFWPMSKYRTGNLEIQSHSHSLHDREFCYNGNCGIKTLVWSKEEILKDIKKSKEIIGNDPIAYCYPFYKHDAKTREVVKEEFELAFVGGNRKSTRNDDPYLIPRYVILDDITLNDFIEMIS